MQVKVARDGAEYAMEAQTPVALVHKLSLLEDLRLEPCGCCGSTDVRYYAGQSQKGTFQGIQCNACGAKLGLVENRATKSLFKSRKARDGSTAPNKGWQHWGEQQGRRNDEFSAPADGPAPGADTPVAGQVQDSIPFGLLWMLVSSSALWSAIA